MYAIIHAFMKLMGKVGGSYIIINIFPLMFSVPRRYPRIMLRKNLSLSIFPISLAAKA